MAKLTLKVLLARVAVASLCASAATFAQAGGNGNGGNGSGGAHGAATAGMTYHGEPVSSPWNPVPGARPTDADMAGTMAPGTPTSGMSPDGNAKPAKTVQ